MKLLLLVLAVCVGLTLSYRVHHHKRHRREEITDDVRDREAVQCIQEKCKDDAVTFIHPFMIFQGGDPKTIAKNITGDEAQLTKICEGAQSLMTCPTEKCTLSENMKAYIDANDALTYLCSHKADIVAHSSCIIDAYTMEALQQSCAGAMMPLMQKFQEAQEHYQRLRSSVSGVRVSELSASALPSFSELKTALEALPELTCTEVMPLVTCVTKPVKDKCGDAASGLIVGFIEDVVKHSRVFYEKIAPGTHFLPDVSECTATDNAVAAFFNFFF